MSVEGGRYWIGWDREFPPSPEDLQRKVMVHSYTFTDDSDGKWMVPCARSTFGRDSLPVEYAFQDGELVKHVAPAYHDLWRLSGEVLDSKGRDETWRVKAALQVLQVNYRIGEVEITVLQQIGKAVLTRHTSLHILLALVDNDLEQEMVEQKKTSTTRSEASSSVVD